MATYSGYKGRGKNERIVMRNVTEEQKSSTESNPVYKNITFRAIPGSEIEPVGVAKKVKPEPAPEPKQEGSQDEQGK